MDPELSWSSPVPSPTLSPTLSPIPSPSDISPSSSSNPVVKVTNGWKTENEGFIYVSVKGGPTERGMAHGQLLADRIIKFIRTYAYYIYDHTGYTIHLFIQMMADLYMTKSSLDVKYQEIMQEVKGIAAGVVDAVKTGNNISEETKKIVDTTSSPPRIKLTSKSYYSSTSTSSSDRSYVVIDEKAIFLLNGIVSLFYTFPYLEKILNTPEYSYLKKNPVYSEFLLSKSQSISSPSESASASASTSASTSTSTSSSAPSFFDRIFTRQKGGDKCSAFMAVGKDYTKDGRVVYSHITFDDFMPGQFDNIILNLQTSTTETPSSVSADMLMQTFPGGIFSSTDFFMTTHGFMGTETTLGGFDSFELKAPICFRARKAMQYGQTLEDYVTYLNENNSGDYACTWYIAKVKKSDSGADTDEEIMRIELGRRFMNVERTKNGYFIGFNAAYDPRIRNIECSNDGFYDSRRHQGARRIRLEEIMRQCKERGIKIDEDLAIKIISDHKDSYLDKPNNPCSRTICAHYDEDKREYMSDPARPKPNQPRGAVDAKVGSSKLYDSNEFLAIWGRACGAPFDPKTFCEKYILWDNHKEYLEARPTRKWVKCKCVLADKDTDAHNALKVYKESVFGSGESDIFSSSSLSPTPTTTTTPRPTTLPTTLPTTSPTAAASSVTPTPTAQVKDITKSDMQPPSSTLVHSQRSDTDNINGLGGGKYNKKDMKNFMKMIKNKNKKSTKQLVKNRNTKKNKH